MLSSLKNMFKVPDLRWKILFTVLVIVPIFWSLSFSVFKWNGIGARVFIGLGNYVRMWNDGVFRQAFLNNLIFAGLGNPEQHPQPYCCSPSRPSATP